MTEKRYERSEDSDDDAILSKKPDNLEIANDGEKHFGSDITIDWYYKDPQGIVQGPFPTLDMESWYIEGYFDDSLEVARNQPKSFCFLRDINSMKAKAILLN